MSLPQVPYIVKYYGTSLQNTAVDITKYIVEVSMKLQGTGRIRSSTMMLDALEGAFITNTNSGATPLISQNDFILITFTDDNSLSKTAVFSVDQNMKQIDQNGKTLLPLELLGQERALQDIQTTAYYRWWSPYAVLNDLQLRYSISQGANQPMWEFIDPVTSANTNQAPATVLAIYDFSTGISYYDAIMQIITRLNQPTDLGGTGDFYSFTVDDHVSTGGIVVRIFPQGTTTGNIPVIQDSTSDPHRKVTVQLNRAPGTQVFVRGQTSTSLVPVDFHRYASYVEAINNFPTYISSATYIAGINVNVGGVIYQAIASVPINTPPPNATYWTTMTTEQIISQFVSADYPAYLSTSEYFLGQRVASAGNVYQAIQSVPINTPPPNATYWLLISPPINYSLWTNNKVADTTNSCSNPDQAFGQSNFNSPAFPDGNLVIRDRQDPTTGNYKFFRDFAWVRNISDTAIMSDPRQHLYLMGYFQNQFYQGFTVLVDGNLGTPSGAFAGNDRFGNPFLNALVQYDGQEWIVIRNPAVGDEVAILLEGQVYEFNVTPQTNLDFGNAQNHPGWPYKYRASTTGTLSWQNISGTAGGNDCFHPPASITSVAGLLPNKINGQDYSVFTAGSAIQITYTYSFVQAAYQEMQSLLQKIASMGTKFLSSLGFGQINNEYTLSTSEKNQTQATQYYSYGWWYALPIPYPFSKFNGISESVGQLYGGNQRNDQQTANYFAALDINNGNYSHFGMTGFNHIDAPDMGSPFTGIQFYFQFNIFLNGTTKQPFQGNLPFTVTMYDDERNVWRADFHYRLMGDVQLIQIPFSNFSVSRPSRIPFQIDTLSDIVEVIAPGELQILNIFDTKRVRLITIQFAQSYDEYLRYMPVSIDNLIRSLEAGLSGTFTVNFVGTIDGLGFTKTPFVSSGVIYDRVINPPIIDASNVRNYVQLKSIAVAEAQLSQLQFEQFTIQRKGSCDLVIEQSIYYVNADLISQEDLPGTPNSRLLILMSDELSYDSVNGFMRTMNVTRRLY